MGKLPIVVGLVLALGGSAAHHPAVPERPDAREFVAHGAPLAGGLMAVVVVDNEDDTRCARSPTSTDLPVPARLGETIPLGDTMYTVRGVGLARRGPERVWLVAEVQVALAGCGGSGSLWEFLFAAADGTIHQPTPRGRRGEFTSYEIPPGGWAAGRVFFDLPADAVRGGMVGFRWPGTHPAPLRPYGLWPVPANPPTVRGPHAYPAG